MIKFKQKDFSNYIASGALKGATIGATVGSIATGGLGAPTNIKVPSKGPKFIKKGIEGYNNMTTIKTVKDWKDKDGKRIETGSHTEETTSGLQSLAIVGTTTILGAALGALFGVVKEVDKRVSHTTANARLMANVLKELAKKGYKEGQQFTRDPKEANLMKIKVCIVITRDGADFKALINTVNDTKLKSVTEKVIKSLTGPTQVRNNLASNRYNEITISTISNTPSNVKTVSELASGFIKAGYSVYLVEVG
jgi:hypothetical protein